MESEKLEVFSLLHHISQLGLAFILTYFIYGSAVDFPFFFDDLDHFPYIASTTLLDIWQSAGGFPYFRPLGATIWRISYVIFGENDPQFLHLLNLITHATNGYLVGRLFIQLKQQTNSSKYSTHVQDTFLGSFIATWLFILYPFSYQAVPWIGAYYHILVTTLVLIALLSHGRYTATGHRHWLVFGLTAATLAPFAHENGILVLPLIFLITLIQPSSQSKIRNLKSKIPWLLPPLIWLPIWLAAPKARAGNFALNNLETIWQNTAYYLQGLAYQLTIFGGYIRDTFGWNDLWTAVALSLLALTLTTLILSTQHSALSSVDSLLLPSTIFFIAAAPAILLLPFAYNISAPRLQMLPSIGAALLWANVIWTLYDRVSRWFMNRPKIDWLLRVSSSLGVTVIFLIGSISMIGRHMNQHDVLGDIWWEAADLTTAANDNGRSTIFINLPSSLTERTTTFPLGHEGTVFMVPYIPTQRIIEVNTGRPANFALLRYEDIRPEHDYIYDVLGDNKDWPQLIAEHPEALVYNTEYRPSGAIFLKAVGGLQPAEGDQNWQMKPADHELKLIQSSVETSINNGTQTVEIQLDWHTTESLPWELTFFVHIIDKSGNLIAQADGNGWANTFPLAQWPLNKTITDTRTVEIENDFDAPTVRIGLYNWMTGERIPLETADGTPVPDNAYTLP